MLDRPRDAPARLIAALDVADTQQAAALARTLAGQVGLVKLGLEFFVAQGPAGVRAVADAGLPIFLDLKLHDIPNTVAGAVRRVLPMAPAMLTLHASGGRAMLAAAREAAERGSGARPMLLAVTVLTSLGVGALAETGVAGGPVQQVLRLARLAAEAGMDGLVCSPGEVAAIRAALGDRLALVVPGIRPVGSDPGDQARIATPAEAVAAGADWLVIGRPITQAANAAGAARAIAESLAA
jgi:orotidine-5'-phosphate decarboxylase